MTLEEKISTIDSPSLESIADVGLLPSGDADTIENFFLKFIKPRLPNESVVKQWHNILMEYTEEKHWSELSCCIRFGNSGGKKKSSEGEAGYYKLRRGWLTQNTSDNFEYFFADNAFPAFVYKMALDKFCPASVDELREMFQKHKFPYGFGFMIDKTVNEHKGVVVDVARNPGFLGNYKLSHIFDAGEFFDIGGAKYGDASLTSKYYPIGHSDDYLKQSDRIRRMPISYDAKKVIVAKFLRFAHPFNYFLTPTKKHHICGEPVYKKDIGEDPRMISYVRWYLQNTYPKEYKEFLERIMWYGDPDGDESVGVEKIAITYGLSVNSKGGGKPTKAPAKPKNIIEFDKINAVYLDSFKVGEIANQVLRAIIQGGVNSGKISSAEIDEFKSRKGKRTSTFMLSLPLLAISRKDSNGKNRYYEEPIDCYGEELFLNSQWPKKDNKIKANLIQWILNWIAANGGKI